MSTTRIRRPFVAPIAAITLLCVPERSISLQQSLLFLNTRPRYQRQRHSQLHLAGGYGRGAEIWPECNENPILLKDSFPNGVIPEVAVERMRLARGEEPAAATIEDEDLSARPRRRFVPRAVRSILRRAAAGAQEEESEMDIESTVKLDVVPGIIAFLLLARGLAKPIDLLLVTFVSGYLLILAQLGKTLRDDGVTPVLPSLPPQGHVPALVSNPLGQSFVESKFYELWLRFGSILSLFGPLLLLGRYLYADEIDNALFCGRPIFLLCCQAMSEGVSRMFMAPLPIRILVPVAYNVIRLGPLWQWAVSDVPLVGGVGRALAVLNLAYWALNLFAFLLPVATMRYLRAHFYCVEASEVIVRPGMKSSVGLVE